MDPITKEILKNMVEIDDEGNIVMTEPKMYFTGDDRIDFALNHASADSIDELLDILEGCFLEWAGCELLDNDYDGASWWDDCASEVRRCIRDLVKKTDISAS